MRWSSVVLLLSVAATDPLPAQRFTIVNTNDRAHADVVTVSVPFARGTFRSLGDIAVEGRPAEGRPLAHWPDGSLALAQLHVRADVPANGERTFVASRAEGPIAADPAPPFRIPSRLPLHTEVEDAFGKRYVAHWTPDERFGPDGLVHASALVQMHRIRSAHVADDGTRFLSLVGWWIRFAGSHRAELTIALDNGTEPDGPAPVVGPVRVRSFALVSDAPGLALAARFAAENLLPAPTQSGGGVRHQLLGPSAHVYLGDRTRKAFRFDVVVDGAAADPSPAALFGFADVDDVRASGAFGTSGGPAPAAFDDDRTVGALMHWRRTARFGPFGSFGDPLDPAQPGAERTGDAVLHDVLRWRSPALLRVAEGMVLQHGLRPSPGAPRLPADLAPFRQGLGPRAIARPHGFVALDYEHFGVGLLADHWWMTGDPFAADELARLGRALPALWRGLPFVTARGEGWTLIAAVAIARATGDASLLAAARDRVHATILPRLGQSPQPYALRQPGHDDAFGREVAFDAPWQMAALARGLHAVARWTDDAHAAQAVVQVAAVMAGPGWVEGVGPKMLVAATDPSRYRMPMQHGPREGTGRHAAGAFVLAAEIAGANPETHDLAQLFLRRAEFLVEPCLVDPRAAHSDPWLQLALDRRQPTR